MAQFLCNSCNSQKIGLQFKEETNKVLNLGHCFVFCRNLDALESR
jgi:hypothetical protein